MLSLHSFASWIPENRVNVGSMSVDTGLSAEILSVYKLIYGLKTIPISKINILSMMTRVMTQLLSKFSDIDRIRYLIYVHTSPIVAPYGYPLIYTIKQIFNMPKTISFGMSLYKCVSFFKALELISILLRRTPNDYAVILTGEIAYTKKLRVIPKTTIVGDASTAALISLNHLEHVMLSHLIRFIPGYSEGIYLSDAAMVQFDQVFISLMTDVIHDAIYKAGISMKHINLILPHNVNVPTWVKIANDLYIPIEKIFLDNISQYGHCFCSDQVINLQSAISKHRIKRGDYYVMAACGMGFYFAAAVFRY